MAGLASGNTDTSCAFFENDISFLVTLVLLRALIRVVNVMFKQKWQLLERTYAVVSPLKSDRYRR
ncbi:Hypothetical predicted protein, partial [Paramuricea clavata]